MAEPAPERYRGGPYPFAEARATILNYALPVLRQGALPHFGEDRFTPERLLAEAEGWRACFLQFFLQKA